MEILALSKINFQNYLKRNDISNDNVKDKKDLFFISINDTWGPNSTPYLKETDNVKVLFFDDTTDDLDIPIIGSGGQKKSIKAFSKKQSSELFEFILKNLNKKRCIIHCSAGISRSGAVASFINDFIGGNYSDFKELNSMIFPNSTVTKLLRNTAVDYGYSPFGAEGEAIKYE